MKLLRTCIISCALILLCVSSWAVYGVRIFDLNNTPTPPNPVRVWGKVTSESPLKLSDGRAEISVSGLTAKLGDFVVVTGDWNGSVLVAAATSPYTGEMISIPAGSFMMGNNGSEPYSDPWELPQHSVELAAYQIGKYEVTRGEYKQFMNAGGYSNPVYWSEDGLWWKGNRVKPDFWDESQNWGNPPGGLTQTDSHPVVGVTYYEAEAFCNWAGGHLPTEAQWERAARWTGTHANVYPWGDTWQLQNCNSWTDTLYSGFQSAPVGSYPAGASPSGCQDMAGNVWEWCQDWCKSYPGSTSPFDYTGRTRIVRGGGWNSQDSLSRCAYRFASLPDVDRSYIGFRVAR